MTGSLCVGVIRVPVALNTLGVVYTKALVAPDAPGVVGLILNPLCKMVE